MIDKKDLVKELINLGCIKFGEFKLKSGLSSDYYVDLRELPNDNALFQEVARELAKFVPKDDDKLRLVGVPHGAVPLATTIANFCGKGQILLNKEKKAYGAGDCTVSNNYRYLIVEDVMTTGSSIIETIEKIGGEKVTQVIVVVDRESGGVDTIRAKYPHVEVHSLLKISDLQEYFN